MTESEKNLVKRFQKGESGVFEALYAEYGKRIYRFALRLCGNPSDAEDLTQEVFLAAYQGKESFAGRSTVATWLYRITLYRHRRVQGQTPDTVPLDAEHTEADSARYQIQDSSPASVDRLTLDTALAALPANLREAFLLVKAEGLTCREAALVLDIPLGTVKFHVHEAIVRLQKHLIAGEWEPNSKPTSGRKETLYAV